VKALKVRFDSLGAAGGPAVQLYGVSLDSLAETERYARSHALTFPITRFTSQKVRRLYKAKSVPLAVVLDEEGRVLYSRTGVLTSGAVSDSLFEAIVRKRPPRRVATAVHR